MKRLIVIFMIFTVLLSFSACKGMSVSNEMYNEISDYVLQNNHIVSTDTETEFFEYETNGLSIGGVYYGYYYTAGNEILLPDFYSGNDIDIIRNDKSEADGGTYFGKPNNGTDWCYVKQIADRWYYYELHWA